MVSNYRVFKTVLLFLSIVTMGGMSIIANAEPVKQSIVEKLVSAFPAPAENEFATYDSVLKAFIRSIKENNPDDSFKCFPVNEYYHAYTCDNCVKRLKAFSYKSNPIPDLDYANYLKAIEYFNREYILFVYTVLYSDQSDLKDIVPIDLKTKEGQEKLEEIKAQIDVKKLRRLIGEIKISEVIDKKVTSEIDLAMGAKEEKLVMTTVEINREKFPMTFVVAKIDSNWRIIYIDWD